MSRKSGQVALDWNETKLPAGEEPTWASFDYLKLRETLETIVAAMEASAREVEQAPLSSEEGKADSTLHLAVSNDQLPVAKSDS
jgi:hypothetical protein